MRSGAVITVVRRRVEMVFSRVAFAAVCAGALWLTFLPPGLLEYSQLAQGLIVIWLCGWIISLQASVKTVITSDGLEVTNLGVQYWVPFAAVSWVQSTDEVVVHLTSGRRLKAAAGAPPENPWRPHTTHTGERAVGLIEVNTNCNLDCPICFDVCPPSGERARRQVVKGLLQRDQREVRPVLPPDHAPRVDRHWLDQRAHHRTRDGRLAHHGQDRRLTVPDVVRCFAGSAHVRVVDGRLRPRVREQPERRVLPFGRDVVAGPAADCQSSQVRQPHGGRTGERMTGWHEEGERFPHYEAVTKSFGDGHPRHVAEGDVERAGQELRHRRGEARVETGVELETVLPAPCLGEHPGRSRVLADHVHDHPPARPPQLADQVVMRGEKRPDPIEQPFAVRRQDDLACGSIEQTHPQLLLEAPNIPTQRLLGDEQPARGSAEVLFLGHGHEASEQSDVEIIDHAVIVTYSQPDRVDPVRAGVGRR